MRLGGKGESEVGEGNEAAEEEDEGEKVEEEENDKEVGWGRGTPTR